MSFPPYGHPLMDPATLLRAAEMYINCNNLDADVRGAGGDSDDDGTEWSACPGEEPAGLYEKISKDPAFLRLDEGYQESGRVLSRTKLLARAHDTRAQLAEELLELSSPYLEGLLACPSVLQHTQESVTELARDVDRLCQECDSCVRSREELTEKAEFIEFQVNRLGDWVEYLESVAPEDLGFTDGCQEYTSGAGYTPSLLEGPADINPYTSNSLPRGPPPLLMAAYKESIEKRKQATEAADRAMQELLAEEEAADKRKGGKSNAPAGKANGSAGKKKSKKKGKPAKRKPVPAQAAAESDDDEDAHNSNGATNNGASPSHSPGDEDRFHDAQEHLGPASGCTMLPAGKISVQMSEAEVAQMQGLMAEQRAQMKKPARSGKQAAADIAKASAFEALRLLGEDESALDALARAHAERRAASRNASATGEAGPSASSASAGLSTSARHAAQRGDQGSRAPGASVSAHGGLAGQMFGLDIEAAAPLGSGVRELRRACQEHSVWLHPAFLNAMNPNNRKYIPLLRALYVSLSKAEQKQFWDVIPQRSTHAPPPVSAAAAPTYGSDTAVRPAPFLVANAPGSRPIGAAAAQRDTAGLAPAGFASLGASGARLAARKPPAAVPEQWTSAAAVGCEDGGSEHEDDLCVICMERTRNALVMPCRHTVCCVECMTDVHETLGFCPYCRAAIEEVYQIG